MFSHELYKFINLKIVNYELSDLKQNEIFTEGMIKRIFSNINGEVDLITDSTLSKSFLILVLNTKYKKIGGIKLYLKNPNPINDSLKFFLWRKRPQKHKSTKVACWPLPIVLRNGVLHRKINTINSVSLRFNWARLHKITAAIIAKQS